MSIYVHFEGLHFIKRQGRLCLYHLSSPLLFKWKALNPDAQPGKTLFQEQHLASWQALRVSCLGSFAVVSLGSVTCLRYPGLPGWHVQAAANSSLFTFSSENHFPVLMSCRTHFSPTARGNSRTRCMSRCCPPNDFLPGLCLLNPSEPLGHSVLP